MAAASTIRGRFVCAEFKSWESFNDGKTGEVVSAGESLKVYVFTPHDSELCLIKPGKGQKAGELAAEFDGFEFGDMCEIITGPRYSWGYSGLFQVDALAAV